MVKVSDDRSALIQSIYLAKKGIWFSGFHGELGLNFGGHAFASDGKLLAFVKEKNASHWREKEAILIV